MSKVLYDKISQRSKEIAEKNNVDLSLIKESSVWQEWLRCWFGAAVEIRDQFREQGLLNSAKAMEGIIATNRRMIREPEDIVIVDAILNPRSEEFADPFQRGYSKDDVREFFYFPGGFRWNLTRKEQQQRRRKRK